MKFAAAPNAPCVLHCFPDLLAPVFDCCGNNNLPRFSGDSYPRDLGAGIDLDAQRLCLATDAPLKPCWCRGSGGECLPSPFPKGASSFPFGKGDESTPIFRARRRSFSYVSPPFGSRDAFLAGRLSSGMLSFGPFPSDLCLVKTGTSSGQS